MRLPRKTSRKSKMTWSQKTRSAAGLAALFLFSFIVPAPMASAAAPSAADPRKYIENGGYIVLDGRSETVSAFHEDQTYTPASILKIATSLAAIRSLGMDYRFRTQFYLGADSDLHIAGKGDPYLVSEEISTIARRLADLGLKKIRHIYLDDSAFTLENSTAEGAGSSLNPYDVSNGALVVNFNTVNIQVAAGGGVQSAEPQTPTLPLMVELGRKLPAGNHRINIISAGNNTLRYAGELFRELLKHEGLEVRGTIGFSRVPPNLPVFYEHASTYDLRKIIEGLMLYSNNFIANQLFLTCGAQISGYPATWEKSRQTLKKILAADIGLDEKSIYMEEGSGLSRKNRLTPRAMARILEKFLPYADLLASDDGVRLKSGTLAGVFSYAGYFKGRQDLQPFVLILNQRKNTRDTVLKILRRRFAETDKQP